MYVYLCLCVACLCLCTCVQSLYIYIYIYMYVYIYIYVIINLIIVSVDGCTNKLNAIVFICVNGASLSEPHTSESSGTSVAFTKIYEVIQINGCVCKRMFKNR